MNGRLYDAITSIAERKYLARVRSELIRPIRGEIIEIGAGTGANFQYYDALSHVLAIEPDDSMFERAEARASNASAAIELIRGDDAILDDLPEESIDHVVATLVLCSVREPSDTLRRVHRVLRPGGTFIAMEHVRDKGVTARLQDLLTPLWIRIFGNCHLNRDTQMALHEANFETTGRLADRPLPFPMRRLIFGTLVKT